MFNWILKRKTKASDTPKQEPEIHLPEFDTREIDVFDVQIQVRCQKGDFTHRIDAPSYIEGVPFPEIYLSKDAARERAQQFMVEWQNEKWRVFGDTLVDVALLGTVEMTFHPRKATFKSRNPLKGTYFSLQRSPWFQEDENPAAT